MGFAQHKCALNKIHQREITRHAYIAANANKEHFSKDKKHT